MADVLETVPGVSVSHTGQPGAQTSVFMRGANSGHTLVLIDGVRVNNAFNGRYDFVDLTVDNVERIEVVRGPQSTRYGSDALGGVINIVMKRGAAEPTGAALLEVGSNASLRARGSAAATVGTLGVSAEISYFDTDNERENGQYTVANGSFGATWQALERLAVGLTGSHRTSEAGAPNDRFTNDPNDLTRNENTQVTLDVHAVPAPWWDARLSLSKGRESTRFDGPEPNPPGFFGDLKAETISESERADLQNVFTIAAGHRLMLDLSTDRTPTEYTSESAYGTTTLDRERLLQRRLGAVRLLAVQELHREPRRARRRLQQLRHPRHRARRGAVHGAGRRDDPARQPGHRLSRPDDLRPLLPRRRAIPTCSRSRARAGTSASSSRCSAAACRSGRRGSTTTSRI